MSVDPSRGGKKGGKKGGGKKGKGGGKKGKGGGGNNNNKNKNKNKNGGGRRGGGGNPAPSQEDIARFKMILEYRFRKALKRKNSLKQKSMLKISRGVRGMFMVVVLDCVLMDAGHWECVLCQVYREPQFGRNEMAVVADGHYDKLYHLKRDYKGEPIYVLKSDFSVWASSAFGKEVLAANELSLPAIDPNEGKNDPIFEQVTKEWFLKT